MNPLTKYYIHLAGGGGGGGDIGPIYSVPPKCTERTWNRRYFWQLFKTLKPLFFSGLKTAVAAKALGREALRTGSRILTDISDNSQAGYRDIILKHVQDTFQNLGARMMGKGR
jgi:hypothetical protein